MIDGVLITEWEGESKVCDLLFRVAEVMIELKHKLSILVVLVEPVIRLSDDSAPFLLLRWQHSENRFESLTVKFLLQFVIVECYLVVEIPKCESELFPIRHASYTKIKPSLVEVSLDVRRAILRNPEINAVLHLTSAGFGQISGAKIASYDDF